LFAWYYGWTKKDVLELTESEAIDLSKCITEQINDEKKFEARLHGADFQEAVTNLEKSANEINNPWGMDEKDLGEWTKTRIKDWQIRSRGNWQQPKK